MPHTPPQLSANTTPASLIAIIETLSSMNAPAINAYDLGKMAYIKGGLGASKAPKKEFEHVVDALKNFRLLERIDSRTAFLLFGHHSATVAEIACCLDPFAYMSHLSAMEYHGLTDRFPKLLFLTRPPATEWRRQADLRMQKDLESSYEDYKALGFPRLTRPSFDSLKGTKIHVQERSNLGAFRNVSETPLRVATIGRTFLDMLREPALCGGIQHVIDVYRNEAKLKFRLIIDEIDRHGQPIDKVRAGFILTEVCGLNRSLFAQWETFAQRGGSRKLDPDAEFSSNYSEIWKLSINVPSITPESSAYDDA